MNKINKQTLLLHYLKKYLSKKNLRMKPVIISMVARLEENKPITNNQLNSVIKFLVREKVFSGMNTKDITKLFQDIVTTKSKKYNY